MIRFGLALPQWFDVAAKSYEQPRNRYNQQAAGIGKPIIRCVNMYRWCAFCDGWNMDGASNPYKAQILSDLDAAAAQRFAWPTNVTATGEPPIAAATNW